MEPGRWRQIEQLYSAVHARRAEREILLANADPEVRREVERMLAADAASNLLDKTPPEIEAIETISAGESLGPYRIVERIGKGGMGEVWRAVDTRLRRPVAIKFLASDLANHEGRRRFQREAQLASALNHPHIVTVFDVGELDGRQYLVTEFIDGGTLKDWVQRRKPNWKEVVELMAGVADGLAAAHGAGILHRDIKPTNVLVSTNGFAKLADFGLAKIEEPRVPSEETQTLTEGITKPGHVVGTVAYMSPEQASGFPVDARSDIFAFGIMLYELLAGARPFGGRTHLEVQQAILKGSFAPLPELAPAALRAVVEKALQKAPPDRYQRMADMAVELHRLAWPESAPSASVSKPTVSRRSWLWAAAGFLPIAGLGYWRLRNESTPWQNPLTDATFKPFTNFDGMEIQAAISRDGKLVAFISDKDGPLDVFLSPVGSGRFVNLTQGKEEIVIGAVREIGFSADGTEIWLAGPQAPGNRVLPIAIRGRSTRMLSIIGGAPRDYITAAAMAWSPDGKRMVFHGATTGDPIFVGNANGENARQIYVGNGADTHCHYPVWSPDGKWIYFVSGYGTSNQFDLYRISPDDGAPAERLTHQTTWMADPSPLDENTILYVARGADGTGPWLHTLDIPSKTTRRLGDGITHYTSVSASLDGARIVVSQGSEKAGLWSVPILDRVANDNDVSRVTVGPQRARAPRFGGKTLYYLSSLAGDDGLWADRDGRTSEVWRGSDGILLDPAAISPEGERVAALMRHQGKMRLHVMNSTGGGVKALAEKLDGRGAACWSPDGKWIAVGGSDGNDGDKPGLFLVSPESGEYIRITDIISSNPVWSPDGLTIVYVGPILGRVHTLLAVTPGGEKVDLPRIEVRYEGVRYRFIPNSNVLVYMQGVLPSQDFWTLDFKTLKQSQLTSFEDRAAMQNFDMTPDGRRIVFDRIRDNSDIVLIEK